MASELREQVARRLHREYHSIDQNDHDVLVRMDRTTGSLVSVVVAFTRADATSFEREVEACEP